MQVIQWGQFQAVNVTFTILVICCKVQKTALNSDFIQIFSNFIHAGTGADNSNGVNFEYQRKLLSLRSFTVSFRKTDLYSDFTLIFS